MSHEIMMSREPERERDKRKEELRKVGKGIEEVRR
jgi:hypothetical protein